MSKVILISEFSLPFPITGSWTNLYNNYLSTSHQIDYIVCKPSELPEASVTYGVVKRDIKIKLLERWYKNRYYAYLEELKKIIKPDEKYIIQIIDNYGIMKPLITMLENTGLKKQCYLQFFYHGFSPFYENFLGRWFFESIDEMVVLTNDSYRVHKSYYTILPIKFSVLHNGIDTSKFHKIVNSQKEILKKELKIINKKVFIWCSQDRPKKGLGIILDSWKRIYNKERDIILLVIGADRETKIDGVSFLGKIPNDDLPKYYQIADCYLFPTLWHEGFGLSLIEALHCGCYCIASAIGGVSEVLQYGKLGKLIDKPHFVSEWENAMIEFIENPIEFEIIPKDLYSTNEWNLGMNKIISNAKKALE